MVDSLSEAFTFGRMVDLSSGLLILLSMLEVIKIYTSKMSIDMSIDILKKHVELF